MASATDFAALVAQGNYTATLKVLDEALVAADLQQAALQAKLVQLHVNRGFCHQRLGLNRKALKVRLRSQHPRVAGLVLGRVKINFRMGCHPPATTTGL
jgi:hypothetical protein